ncbi:cytidine deaminase [Friedmanniella endophytica]|uniref:Cytidine deaminase n=1 Tax=Microlunatus kandeliicorticis TaxID=1759536 RepID=A0A7W3IV59_9ACTN|nr:cytidine deaminase [Microlunatus kandeliicorticis]MBA8795827.1 cytidine deaminase [Microlunatus kandeliicorticis]
MTDPAADPADRQAEPVTPSDPEDRKIITLATAARARTGATQGACLRDTDGRTYAATDVALASLRLSAISVAVAMAVSSGAAGVEAVAVTGAGPDGTDTAALTELAGAPVPVWVVDPRGAVLEAPGV